MEQGQPGDEVGESAERFREALAQEAAEEVQVVRLLGQDLLIRYVPGLPDYGNFEQKTGTIYIDPALTLQPLQDTLLHEIIHAILQAYEKDSELLVRILTPAMLGLIKDNPHLVRLLTRTGL